MKSYTLPELNAILNCRYYLPKDRFLHYFINRFGYTERDAKNAFKLYLDFPKNIQDADKQNLLEDILAKAVKLVQEIQDTPHIPYRCESYKNKKQIVKILFKENDKINEVIIDFYNTDNILTYAEILKRKIEIITLLPYCCEVDIDKKNTYIFEGDFFDTNDKFYGDKSNIYIAEKYESFRKLNYIKGKGYLLNGEPNIDTEQSYSNYCLRLNEFVKMGNVNTDLHILSDENIKQTNSLNT